MPCGSEYPSPPSPNMNPFTLDYRWILKELVELAVEDRHRTAWSLQARFGLPAERWKREAGGSFRSRGERINGLSIRDGPSTGVFCTSINTAR